MRGQLTGRHLGAALLVLAVAAGFGVGASRLGRDLEVARTAPVAHAVLLHVRKGGAFAGPGGEEAVRDLETRLAYALAAAGVGGVDGHEDRSDEWMIWLYGDDADDVLGAVRPTLDAAGLPAGSWANKRYGRPADPGARKERVELGP